MVSSLKTSAVFTESVQRGRTLGDLLYKADQKQQELVELTLDAAIMVAAEDTIVEQKNAGGADAAFARLTHRELSLPRNPPWRNKEDTFSRSLLVDGVSKEDFSTIYNDLNGEPRAIVNALKERGFLANARHIIPQNGAEWYEACIAEFRKSVETFSDPATVGRALLYARNSSATTGIEGPEQPINPVSLVVDSLTQGALKVSNFGAKRPESVIEKVERESAKKGGSERVAVEQISDIVRLMVHPKDPAHADAFAYYLNQLKGRDMFYEENRIKGRGYMSQHHLVRIGENIDLEHRGVVAEISLVPEQTQVVEGITHWVYEFLRTAKLEDGSISPALLEKDVVALRNLHEIVVRQSEHVLGIEAVSDIAKPRRLDDFTTTADLAKRTLELEELSVLLNIHAATQMTPEWQMEYAKLARGLAERGHPRVLETLPDTIRDLPPPPKREFEKSIIAGLAK